MVYGKIFLIGLKMKRIPNVTPLLKDNQELLAKLNNITKVSFLDKNGIIWKPFSNGKWFGRTAYWNKKLLKYE
jgi:hypothetical protein